MKDKKWTDYVGQTIDARYAVERNIDGADVPVIQEGTVTVCLDDVGSVVLDDDGVMVYPFDEKFQLLNK